MFARQVRCAPGSLWASNAVPWRGVAGVAWRGGRPAQARCHRLCACPAACRIPQRAGKDYAAEPIRRRWHRPKLWVFLASSACWISASSYIFNSTKMLTPRDGLSHVSAVHAGHAAPSDRASKSAAALPAVDRGLYPVGNLNLVPPAPAHWHARLRVPGHLQPHLQPHLHPHLHPHLQPPAAIPPCAAAPARTAW